MAATPSLEKNGLRRKKIIFLGSSVVYRSESLGESFADFLEKRDGIAVIKEAVPGMTLVEEAFHGRLP